MFRGMVTPKSARENQIASDLIHDEIFLIERGIKTRQQTNFRNIIVEDTLITDKTIPTQKIINGFDFSQSTLEVLAHGLSDGDYVEFFTTGVLPSYLQDDTEYQVVIVDDDNIKIYQKRDPEMTPILITDIGTGILSIKKVTTAEQFLKAWDEFYVYDDAPTYIFILETIEKHFRNLGFTITRMVAPSNKTLRWKIEW